MRNIEISVGEYYHVFNRGVLKQNIFHTDADYARFLFSILHLQSPVGFPQMSRPAQQFVKHSVFDIDTEIINNIVVQRYVELVSFCLMPNHFHLILKEKEEGGIARYMQRVLNGYTKFCNTKYQRSGHLFQGPYKATHVSANDQLLYLSAYIHRNPRELKKWRNRENVYPWSSYQDFVDENRWGSLLSPDIILEQFANKEKYADFLKTSTAKLLEEELDVKHRVFDIDSLT